MDYKIQNGKIGDESRFAYIQVEGWRAAYSDILAPEVLKKYLDIEYVTSIYRKLMERKKGNGLIMQVGEKDHCIAYWDRARNCSESNIAEIICIHSLKDNWRKGFGSKMMKRICDEASEQGYSQMILWVFEKNIRARLFYEANGFKITAINEQISNFAQTYPTNLKASSNEALLFMRRYRFANCSCFSCCFKDAYPSSNVQ